MQESNYLLAFKIAAAPAPISKQLEVFGQYRKANKNYKFHIYFDRRVYQYWSGEIELPFKCTINNNRFCLYKGENEKEEPG